MVGSNTTGVVALMTDMKTSGNFAKVKSPRDSMRSVSFSRFMGTGAVNAAIAVFIAEFCVFPATVALNYIFPESFKINIHDAFLNTSFGGV